LVDRKTSRKIEITQFARPTPAGPDYDSTIIGALELSEKKWVLRFDFPESSGIHDMLSKPAARNWSICSDAGDILEPEKHPRDANSVARNLLFE
jgi:hypothetical protein